jgi:hypothetical protein
VQNGLSSRSKFAFGMAKCFPAGLFTSHVCIHIIYRVSEIAQPVDRDRRYKMTADILNCSVLKLSSFISLNIGSSYRGSSWFYSNNRPVKIRNKGNCYAIEIKLGYGNKNA